MLSRRRNFRLATNVDGFLTDREGQILYTLAHRCSGKGSIVEIGSWKGKSTIWLAQGVKDAGRRVKVYAVDPHIGSVEHQEAGRKIWTFEEFRENIRRAGLEEIVHPLVATSEAARRTFTEPVEVLFIDGAHDFDSVCQDYRLWSDLVVPGGYIAFHDTPWPGVRQATRQIFRQGIFEGMYFQDTLILVRKALRVTAKERFKSGAMLLMHDWFDATCRGRGGKKFRSLGRGMAKSLRDCIYAL